MPRISNNLTIHGGVPKDFAKWPKEDQFDKFAEFAAEKFFDFKFPPLPPSSKKLDRLERSEERHDFKKSLIKYTHSRLLENQELVRNFINNFRCREFKDEWLEFIEAYVGYPARPSTPEPEEEAEVEAATTPIPPILPVPNSSTPSTSTFHMTPAEMSLFCEPTPEDILLFEKWGSEDEKLSPLPASQIVD